MFPVNFRFAPVSTDITANSSAPVPRFIAVQPLSDCQSIGDCGASYFPSIAVFAQSIVFTAIQGGLAGKLADYNAAVDQRTALDPQHDAALEQLRQQANAVITALTAFT